MGARQEGRRALIRAAAMFVAVAAFPCPVTAADPAQGHRLAKQWCTSCHVVEPGGTGAEAGPAFATIANDPGMSPERLRGWLTEPHPPMPNLNLIRIEIDSIASYIESLRTPQ